MKLMVIVRQFSCWGPRFTTGKTLRTVQRIGLPSADVIPSRNCSLQALYRTAPLMTNQRHRYLSNSPPDPKKDEPKDLQELSLRQKLQKAVAEYGTTVLVFHIGISLISLGGCYLAVSNGIEIEQFLPKLGLHGETVEKFASNAGTFAIAYGVHKIFAPVRIGITLTATPFIVRYLRHIGFLKK